MSDLLVYGIIFSGKIILFRTRPSFDSDSEKTLAEFEYFALAQILRSLTGAPEIVGRTVCLGVCLEIGTFSPSLVLFFRKALYFGETPIPLFSRTSFPRLG